MKSTLLTLCLLLALSMPGFAAVRHVTTTGAGNFDGSSWANAYPGSSLQAAIDASGPGDEVWVASGTYLPTQGADRSVAFRMRNGVTIYGSFAGTEATLGQRDLSQGLGSVLSGEIGNAGNLDNSYKVIYNEELNNTAILDGFIIRDGNDNRTPTSDGNGLGGGLYNHGFGATGFCHPVIRNCLFRNNAASWGGGAFNNGYSGGNAEPTYINCVFTQNHAYVEAGGMDSYGVGGNASPTLYNCVFDGNTAATNVGAMYCWGGNAGGNCNPVLINCIFVNNVAQNGYCGAVIADNLDENGTTSSGTSVMTLKNCIFWNNSATGISPQFHVRGTGATFVATHCDIDMNGQNAPHVISGTGTGNLSVDPQFVALQAGPGPDGDWMTSDDGLRLQAGSPCIDAGDNADIHTTDLLGSSRIANGTVDMGAYESSPVIGVGEAQPMGMTMALAPNPARGQVLLRYTLPERGELSWSLLDAQGRTVRAQAEGQVEAGAHQQVLDVSKLAPGAYVLRLRVGDAGMVRRLVLAGG